MKSGTTRIPSDGVPVIFVPPIMTQTSPLFLHGFRIILPSGRELVEDDRPIGWLWDRLSACFGIAFEVRWGERSGLQYMPFPPLDHGSIFLLGIGSSTLVGMSEAIDEYLGLEDGP